MAASNRSMNQIAAGGRFHAMEEQAGSLGSLRTRNIRRVVDALRELGVASRAEIARHTLAREFRHIDPRKARVLLIEAGPRVLAAVDERLSMKAQAQLEKLGVEVRLLRSADRRWLMHLANVAPFPVPR